ncbi:hypothetical protein PIB30_092896 [Stylosanthes scabra]|uniref:Ubiquitin-like protease family profile domain-containing protein n=1 Tax=Stylosanthes scabra TaxID=79078 RepID=A0ABU6QUF9_9FABA|nr:hypothetical protein [Stylosanthes scabra]
MAKKAKDSGKNKGRPRDMKAKGKQKDASRELPPIVEEDVSAVDGEILSYLRDLKQQMTRREDTIMSNLSANTSQTQTLVLLPAQQAKAIEVLAHKVSELEEAYKGVQNNVTFGRTERVTVLGKVKECSCTSSLFALIVGLFVPAFQGKLEFINFSSRDMDILYLIKQRYAGSPFAFGSHNRSEMTAEETPLCLDLAFRPLPGMRFSGTELAVAAYIFSNHGDERERLYEDSHCDGTRYRFWSPRPGCELYDDYMIINPEQFNQATMDYIIGRYTGYADDLMMIYIPIHTKNHWYLMIVDMWDKKLVYLDSFQSPDPEETKFRVSLMVEVVFLGSQGCNSAACVDV